MDTANSQPSMFLDARTLRTQRTAQTYHPATRLPIINRKGGTRLPRKDGEILLEGALVGSGCESLDSQSSAESGGAGRVGPDSGLKRVGSPGLGNQLKRWFRVYTGFVSGKSSVVCTNPPTGEGGQSKIEFVPKQVGSLPRGGRWPHLDVACCNKR